jgi:two-component system sensor histidine kinase UhpB
LARRLLLAYAAVLSGAALLLIFAPVTISVPVSLTELIGILATFVVMLVVFDVLLRQSLGPLERLTTVMKSIDPLAPGQRIEVGARAEEVAALTEAFNDMLDRLEGERRESARRALAAQEGERRRIARELHDEIGQVLTGMVLHSETLARRAPGELRSGIEQLREAARSGAVEVRQIARRLRPEALDELGLQSALLALCNEVSDSAGIEIARVLERDLPLNTEQELVIYRVAQESITNVVRHADAKRLDLTLRRDGGGVLLVVSDDGVGIREASDMSSHRARRRGTVPWVSARMRDRGWTHSAAARPARRSVRRPGGEPCDARARAEPWSAPPGWLVEHLDDRAERDDVDVPAPCDARGRQQLL